MVTKAAPPNLIVTPKEQAVLALIRQHQPISRGDLARVMRANRLTVGNHLRVLRLAGLIQHEGVGRHTRWWIAEAPSKAALSPIEQVASVWHYARRCGARG